MNESEVVGPEFEITDEAFRHAIQVSRFQVGEEFEIVFGGLEALRVQITKIAKKSAVVRVVGRRPLPALPRPWIHLAFAVSKWPVFEEVLEKCVELGVQSVQPLLTDFSFIRNRRDWPESRQARLQKIIQSATEQSGRSSLLDLKEPLTLQEFTKTLNPEAGAPCLFAYEGPSAFRLHEAMAQLPLKDITDIWAIVGSEGGFSASEVAHMSERGVPAVTMGPQILRAETACFALISVIKYELNLMG
jgi:16S rRNA (uracil1498-N3)-methyltransferase